MYAYTDISQCVLQLGKYIIHTCIRGGEEKKKETKRTRFFSCLILAHNEDLGPVECVLI
jgi:hypothetical protein